MAIETSVAQEAAVNGQHAATQDTTTTAAGNFFEAICEFFPNVENAMIHRLISDDR